MKLTRIQSRGYHGSRSPQQTGKLTTVNTEIQQLVTNLAFASNWTPLHFISSSWYMTVVCTAVSCAARQNSCSIVFGCEWRLGGRSSVGPNTVARFLSPILLRLSCSETLHMPCARCTPTFFDPNHNFNPNPNVVQQPDKLSRPSNQKRNYHYLPSATLWPWSLYA